MKKVIIAVCMFLANFAHAWEFSRNPDRFPSVGINATSSRLNGDRTNVDAPGDPFQRVETDSGNMDYETYGADLRLPINDGITLNFSYDHVDYNNSLTREGNVFKSMDDFSGNKFGIGLRLYLNK